jgi:acid phosphatase (class A)
MKYAFSALVLLVSTISCGAFAEDIMPRFLPPNAIDLSAILPPPPAQDSAVSKAEIAEILRAQAEATAAGQAQAVADSKEEVFLFGSVLGPNFNAGALPITAKFFQHVGTTETEFVTPAKIAFARPRPPLADGTIVPCEPLRPSASYPSGHSTYAYLDAIVLVQMIPEMREAIFARAAEFAHNRVVCGVHYPSDLEAGKISAFAIGAYLLANPAFRTELGPAKTEARKALGLGAR